MTQTLKPGLMARWLEAHWLWILLPVVLIKVAIAYGLPMTGDEAYFVLWGKHLDFGYYDHPPMAGWMMALQLLVSDHHLWLRVPGLVTELIIAAALYALFRPVDAIKARWLALLFTLSPLSLINVFTLTDTGCILFAALAFVAAARGLLTQHIRWAVLAGVSLGLAFLSKYFAVFLGLGFVIFYAFAGRRFWRHGLVLVLVAIPFGLLNLYWNYTHCWSNLLFNLVNRNAGGGFGWQSLLAYLGMMGYVILPPIWLALRAAQQQRSSLRANLQPVISLAATLSWTAGLGFLWVSLSKDIGLHWVLWFYPMVLVLLLPLPVARWAKLTKIVSWVSVVHVVVLLGILYAPFSVWKSQPRVQWYLLAMTEAPAILKQARTEADELQAGAWQPAWEAASARKSLGVDALVPDQPKAERAIATLSYSSASVLAYQVREPVMVMGEGAKYARQDDSLTDFRSLDGKAVLLLLKKPNEQPNAENWFATSRRFSLTYRGQTFHFLAGEGFRYEAYFQQVLVSVRERFYQFPSWLPSGECAFTSRYFAPE